LAARPPEKEENTVRSLRQTVVFPKRRRATGATTAAAVAVRAIARRLRRLEEQLGTDERRTDRIVVHWEGCKPSLKNATCTRRLGPDGSLLEVVYLDHSDDALANGSNEDAEPLTHEELDEFVATFPIEAPQDT